MKADTSRSTFDPRKHYQGVYLQQGRVQLDADWNEQVALTAHRGKEMARDLVGPAGVPRVAAGFECTPTADGRDIQISPGRIHVGGEVCENEAPATLSNQPHWPVDAPLVFTERGPVPLAQIPDGQYQVHLDVWPRAITALEDPDLLEPALGGPDTSFRSQLIWQVSLVAMALGAGPTGCRTPLPAWFRSRYESTGSLSAHTDESPAAVDDCELAPAAGYRRLANQHYRVEVHDPGSAGMASFKWSRENGSVVVPWEQRNGRRLTMGSAAGDLQRRFASGDSIELLSDHHLLQGIPGLMLTVEGVADDELIIAEPSSQIPNLNGFGPHPRIRLWEGGPPQPVTDTGPLPLEAGILVTFGAGNYRNGDYWNLPARTQGGGLLWPAENDGTPSALPPAGIHHRYAPLAIVTASGGNLSLMKDCRQIFPPLTDIRAEDVGYDNGRCGTDMQQASTVQEAIDVLCQRPTGGGGVTESCEIRVDPQERVPLDERIRKLVGAGHQHLCLCLAPGEHFIQNTLQLSTDKDDLHTLHLRGCGIASKLTIGKSLALDLRDLRVAALQLQPTAEAGPIVLAGEGKIRLEENHVNGTLEKVAPLIVIEGAGEVLLSGNRLRPTSKDRQRRLRDLFTPSLMDVRLDAAAFRNRHRFRRNTAVAVSRLDARSRADRQSMGDKWKNTLFARGDLSPTLEAQIERIHAMLTAERLSGRALIQQMERLRKIAFAEVPAVALAITDGEARVHLVDNVLDGDLLLYGTRPGSIDDVALDLLFNLQIFSESQGRLTAAGNRFTRVRLAAELTEKIKAAVKTGKLATDYELFRQTAWSDNQFRALKSVMAATAASFSSNHFNAATIDHVATSFAQQATFTGNLGPTGEKKREMGVLYDVSPTGPLGKGRAGNLLNIVP